ncbi:hypothetical protein [Micromonospora inyonensis]|uniref:Uncharacterized protein n=1 Tax=Micromonospora inyonensis TaxID=47866 RepID=A0A1C6RIB3_9ACTN|nr:hypothetical protein [Micromonospora inyonensis]SCL16904.1 hypothetical protein GA0074694_1815 [Micromonospora inyonensis]
MSTAPEPGLAPEHLRTIRYQGEPVRLVVDGHEFRVRARAEEPGTYDFDWLTGPHDYGFGLSGAAGFTMSPAEMTEAARDFLAQIDPATGYLAE